MNGLDLYQTLQDEVTALQSFIKFDENHFMRERCSAPQKLEAVIQTGEECLRKLNSDNVRDIVHGIVGNLYRINNQPAQAIELLERCVTRATELNDFKRKAISFIRLAEAFKYADMHDLALKTFDQAEEICHAHSLENILDFVLQHKGKCFAEMGKLAEARVSLDEALEIRIRKQDPSLIKSTKLAQESLLRV
ncbi:hypothetical protein [Alkalicoccobacillus gibsonii]|uniref:hypothetical protein n=1 Tax=Alkalicoccobacillus gibsonii TaxID=79881 RepID=UPI0035171A10